jgi:Ser/Thr protein kinase RdoA (MazF antagonist)
MDVSVQPVTPVVSPPARPWLPRPDRLYWPRLSGKRDRPASTGRLEALLAGYGLQPLGEPVAFYRGRGESLVVDTSAGKKILKRYKATVGIEAIRHEHDILGYLARLGFPAPRLVTRPDGLTWSSDGSNESYALFDFLDGYFHYHNYWLPPRQTRQFIYDSGRALAALHQALRDFTPVGHNPSGFRSQDGERWRELDWFLERLAECRGSAADRASRRRLGARLAPVETELPRLDDLLRRADLPRLIIHGDYGPYNLLFKAGEPVVTLDFELARLDWRLTDLAKAVPYFARNRLGFSRPKMAAFLDGYRSLAALPPAELEMLPLVWRFLALRRAVVCAHRYLQDGEAHWARQAEEKLQAASWLSRYQAMPGSLP